MQHKHFQRKYFLRCAQKIIMYSHFYAVQLVNWFSVEQCARSKALAECREVKLTCLGKLGFRKKNICALLPLDTLTDVMWWQHDQICPRSLRKLLCAERLALGLKSGDTPNVFNPLMSISVCVFVCVCVYICMLEGLIMPFLQAVSLWNTKLRTEPFVLELLFPL